MVNYQPLIRYSIKISSDIETKINTGKTYLYVYVNFLDKETLYSCIELDKENDYTSVAHCLKVLADSLFLKGKNDSTSINSET